VEALPTLSSSSDDDTKSTESDGEYYSERDPDVDVRMEEDVDAPDGVDLDGNVDMERDCEDEEDEEEEDEKEEEEVVDEDEEEDENDGKEPQTIGQGEMGNPSADDAPAVLPVHGQEMREHTPCPEPRASAPRPQTPEPPPRC
jgi:hypothetical protein